MFCKIMSKDIESGFYELNLPSTFLGATFRFLVVILIATALFFIAPNSWSGWKIGLVVGLIVGALWAVSWRWEGVENRLIVWLVVYLGGVALWCRHYPAELTLGALTCMYVGGEAVMFILHYQLRKWTQRTESRKEEIEQGGSQ